MTHPSGPSDQVTALFGERQRFETWLATLEAKRSTTPPHIYARVHADYTARLQRIIEQLGHHRAALLEMESALTDRLTALDIDEAKQRDEAAEADLRATVGELSPQHHREIVERTEAAIGDIGDERQRVQAELAHLRELIEGASSPAAHASTGDETSEEGESTEPAPRTSGASAAPVNTPVNTPEWAPTHAAPHGSASSVSPAQPTPDSSRAFDDLEFLKTMTGSRPSGESVAVGNGTSPRSAEGARAAASERLGASAGAADVATATPTPPTSSAQAPETTTQEMLPPAKPKVIPTSQIASAPASGLPLIMPDQESTPDEHTAPSGRASQPVPAYLKDTPPEQVKTLKCQECGTLNYPTEWYCERCGAELAAL